MNISRKRLPIDKIQRPQLNTEKTLTNGKRDRNDSRLKLLTHMVEPTRWVHITNTTMHSKRAQKLSTITTENKILTSRPQSKLYIRIFLLLDSYAHLFIHLSNYKMIL